MKEPKYENIFITEEKDGYILNVKLGKHKLPNGDLVDDYNTAYIGDSLTDVAIYRALINAVSYFIDYKRIDIKKKK